MAKIPFTLEAWLKDKSQKVVDKDGRPVRIICTDADGLYPIIGLLDNKTPLPCGKDGRPPYIGGGGGTLFLVTSEPELSEFEKAVGNLLILAEGRDHYEGQAEHIKKVAAELLELAKKEVMKNLPRWSPNDIYPELNDVVMGSIGTDDNFFIHKGRIIHLESLEKLPGFNE